MKNEEGGVFVYIYFMKVFVYNQLFVERVLVGRIFL